MFSQGNKLGQLLDENPALMDRRLQTTVCKEAQAIQES